MSGNFCELCWDYYDANYYGNSPAVDPRGPSSARLRVYKGACWVSDSKDCRISRRSSITPICCSGYQYIGFRVVRTAGSNDENSRAEETTKHSGIEVSLGVSTGDVLSSPRINLHSFRFLVCEGKRIRCRY